MERDDQWFERLLDGTQEQLLRYALRRASPEDAEDVVADTYLVAWRRREAVPDPPEHLLWLYGVARRQLANRRRGSARLQRLRLRLAGEPAQTLTTPSEDDPRVDAIREALLRMPPDDAELLRLLAWEGLSQREAAAVLDTTENAVALRASRARRRLSELLDRSPVDVDMNR